MIAVKALSNQHSITTLCRVLRVNRSTYYKWLHRSPSVRELENRSIRAAVLVLYAKTDKRLGTRKIKDCLNRDYCINISCGRVYRLMKTMNLPKMSTVKPPKTPQIKTDDSNCINLLAKNFNQPAPNMVWVCDFTYILAANRFYYLCAVLDLFARKIVSFKLSDRINTKLAIDTVNIALSTTFFHTDSCFILTGVLSSPLKNSGNILILLILFSLFPLKGILNGFYNSVRHHSHNNDPSPNQKKALFMPV